MKRPRRPGEVVCRCRRYGFPHRFMGGDCKGGLWVSELWENEKWGRCRDCPLRVDGDADEGLRCQVLDGIEDLRECPELAEHIRFEGVRLYGVNKPPERRMGWRRG